MRGKLFIVFLLLILFTSAIYAIDTTSLKQGIEQASTQVSDFFSTTTRDEVVIITGSSISVEDKILFNLLKSQVNEVQGLEIITDKYALSAEELKGKDFVLIGGEKTNLVSKKLFLENLLINKDTTTVSPMVLVFATADSRKVMILYSEKEINNNGNKAVEKSPLSNIMDKKYVPAAATFLSILLLYLWSILGKTIMSFISDFTSSKLIQKITAKKKVKKKEVQHLKLHEFIDKTEILALILTTLVFSLTMSWSWSNNMADFKRMLVINLIIVGVISTLRESVRQFSCYKHKLRTEYVFWPFGTILTLISTFFGNTFSLVSYTLLDENDDEKKYGRTSFFISLFTYLFAVIVYIINIFQPNLVLQMIFVYSIMILFIELFPLPPMTGNDIKKWNFSIWLIFYLIVSISYVYMNFTIYV